MVTRVLRLTHLHTWKALVSKLVVHGPMAMAEIHQNVYASIYIFGKNVLPLSYGAFEGSAYTHHLKLITSQPPGQIAELWEINVFPSMCSLDSDKNMAPVKQRSERRRWIGGRRFLWSTNSKLIRTAKLQFFFYGAPHLRS